MAAPEWGTKRQCPKCGTRFYDLGNDDPIICIDCESKFKPEIILKSKLAPLELASNNKEDDVEEELLEDDSDDDVVVDADDNTVILSDDDDSNVTDVVAKTDSNSTGE